MTLVATLIIVIILIVTSYYCGRKTEVKCVHEYKHYANFYPYGDTSRRISSQEYRCSKCNKVIYRDV